MATLTILHRNTDTEIPFQLLDDDDNVIDVDDILDVSVEIIHKFRLDTVASYTMGELDIDNTDDTVTVFFENTDNVDIATGQYKIRVQWDVADTDFTGGVRHTTDEADLLLLKA